MEICHFNLVLKDEVQIFCLNSGGCHALGGRYSQPASVRHPAEPAHPKAALFAFWL